MNEFSRRTPVDAYLQAFNVLIGPIQWFQGKKGEMKMKSLLVTYLRIPTYLLDRATSLSRVKQVSK